MTFDAFIETAWVDHGDQPDAVAHRLETSLHWVQTSDHVVPFARLATHVLGEHLGQWARGIALLEALRALPACTGEAAADAVAQRIATLRHVSGDRAALLGLAPAARVAGLAEAASIHGGRNAFDAALDAYAEALSLAAPGLAPGSPAIRALAVGGNNLAAALEEKPDRTIRETEGMVAAARSALEYWQQAGTWLETERAEYRLTRSLLQAGRPDAAIQSARRCIAVCAANDAPALERFFGYAVLALAQRAAGDGSFTAARARALEFHARVPDADRAWCESEIRALAEADHADGPTGERQ